MSYTVVLLPILSVLSLTQDKLGVPAQIWETANAQQTFFMQNYWSSEPQLKLLNPNELSSKISNNASEINQFLKEKGFDIQLKPFKNSASFGVASVMEILLKWKEKAIEATIASNNKQYPGIQMKMNSNCAVKKLSNGQELLMIETENGDIVCLKQLEDEQPTAEFDLIEYIKSITINDLPIAYDYHDAIFPMLDINQRVDIAWLINLTFPMYPVDFYIAQALQQTKLQMNEEGVAVQSAVAIEVAPRTAMPITKRTFTIDKPFYLWIMRDGINIPVFAGYIDTDAWKKPAKLGK